MRSAGAEIKDTGICSFKVWAPLKDRMVLNIRSPRPEKIEMVRDKEGWFIADVSETGAGTKYFFRPDDENDYPDPASHFQPEGVHGPSEVTDHNSFIWTDDNWRGIPFKDLILYELHIGTFTPEGTFDAVISRLDDLKETGINAIELLPVSPFPGTRNWGYDGVYPYAVQNSYGGPEGLKRLVNACHRAGIAVFLDLVYNHLGPEGNYFSRYGPWFTSNYRTPWGDAMNFDGEWSDGVREYFSENALHWFRNYHIDGLRLDAVHMVFDNGAVHFWELTSGKVKELEQKLGRPLYMIAESDLNSPKVVRSPEAGGLGFDAQWLDDFHHALYVLLDRKGADRYADFGQMEQLAKAYTDGFVHSGEFVNFRKRRHGVSSVGVPGDRFVVFNQNHDQIGNRVMGERLSALVDFERLKLAAAAILLSPYVPMLFMGEEYAEEAPFFYFVSHSEEPLIKLVQEGRRKEFEAFNWKIDPPDPQSEDTFNRSRLQWHKRGEGRHRIMLQWHKKLIGLRRSHPILGNYNKNDIRADISGQEVLILKRQNPEGTGHLLCLFNFSDREQEYVIPALAESWRKILDSGELQWLEDPERLLPDGVACGQVIRLRPWGVVVYESSQQ